MGGTFHSPVFRCSRHVEHESGHSPGAGACLCFGRGQSQRAQTWVPALPLTPRPAALSAHVAFSSLGSSWVTFLLGIAASTRRGGLGSHQCPGRPSSPQAATACLAQLWWSWGPCLSQSLANRG